MATLDVDVSDAKTAAGEPVVVVTVKGEAVVELEPLVSTLQNVSAKRPQRSVLNLKDLSFISSLAMGVMLAFRRSVMAGGGKVKVAAMQKLVLDSFKRARLDRVFEIVDTLEDALAR
jgi:anti-anti-sigma factor